MLLPPNLEEQIEENHPVRIVDRVIDKIDIMADGSYRYSYYLRDHLGNVRVVYNEDDATTATQITDYYPFGMTARQTAGDEVNKYLYNGKELQEGTDWYDYGARMYDAQIARFCTKDPQGEEFYNQNPYCYTANNPILFIDPTGEIIRIYCGDEAYIDYDSNVDYNEKDEDGNYKYSQFVRDAVTQIQFLISNAQDPEKMVETLANAEDYIVAIYQVDVNEEGKVAYGFGFSWAYGIGTFQFDSRAGIVTTEGGLESPVAVMIHELGHQYLDYELQKEYKEMISKGMDPEEAYKIMMKKDLARDKKDVGDWHTADDKYIIQHWENPMMEFMKQSTRSNHSGEFYKTAGPLTAEPVDKESKNRVKTIIKEFTGN